MTRLRVGLVTAVLVLVALAGVAVAAPIQPAATPTGFDTTGFEIQVHENGSARWTVSHTQILNNESEIQDFETFMAGFPGDNSTIAATFRERSRRMVAGASQVLGRPMNASGFRTDVAIRQFGQTRGVLELSFLWSGFARPTDAGVVVGDVFDGGLYILEGQRLVIERGEGLRFAEALPTPTSLAVPGNLTASTSVTWDGERLFADNRPYVRFVDTDGDPGGPITTPSEGGDVGLLPFAILLVLLLVVALVAVAWTRRTGWREPDEEPTPLESAAASVSPEDLQSDEQRVIDLLEDHGGRMKQVEIVEATDWSKSKVSMVLSEMEDEGNLSKLRVGRENIVSLPGYEPDAAGSPFDDE